MRVERNGRRLVDDTIVCLPATWRGLRSLAIYSRAGFSKRSCPIPEGVTLAAGAKGWTVSAAGLEPFRGFEVKGDRVVLNLAPKQMVLIEEDGVAGIARAAAKTADQIHMRDPFVVTDPDSKSYCLVSSYFAPPGQKGNDGFTFQGKGVQIYESKDLVNWSAPQQVLEIPDWVDCKALWAPEIHRYKDKWYILGTVNSGKGDRGTWTFVSDSLRGPYRPTGRRSVTPPEWKALDGTLWIEDGKPYMVFCHEWVQIQNGEMCCVQMTEDLSTPVGRPTTLFKATDYTANPKGKGCCDHVTDGPFLYRSTKSGKLFMTWSNVDAAGRYLVIVTESASGRLAGPWGNHRVIFEKDGGHGMIFRKFDGSLMFALHRPNSVRNERPRFFEMTDDGKTLTIRRDATK